MKSFLKALLPFLSSLLIIFSAGVLIHLYRSTYLAGHLFSPVLPRAQFSFSVSLPENTGSSGRTLLLRVVKHQSAFLSVNYWHVGRTVLQIPIEDLPNKTKTPNKIRLALWDPGTYMLSFTDTRTGELLRSTTMHVATPLGLYRNDLLLLLVLAVLGYLSGRMALGSFPKLASFSRPPFERLFASRKILFSGLLGASALLIISVGLPRTATLSQEPILTGFHESEGRLDAPRMPLLSYPDPGTKSSGYLVLRHRLDSWLRFGQDLTLFEGPVSLGPNPVSFILPPDDGRYRLTLWTPQSGALQSTHWTLRAIPVSPVFPISLFLGLSLFAGAFFLLGLLKQGSEIPHSPAERVH
jgi:hypothetical protein